MKDETTGKDNLNSGALRLSLMFAPGEKGKGTLHINVKQAKELPRMDPNGLTDGLVKCHLLPDKSVKGKRKTGVIKNNLNPVWEEKFTYEKVTLEELSKERVLEVTVWDHDLKGSNDFIGGVRLGSAPVAASKHKEWMDSIGDEVSHWEAMLAHPGEWVDRWHTLRHTMDPRSVDLSVPSLQATPMQRQQRQGSPSVERRGAELPSDKATRSSSQLLLSTQPLLPEERTEGGQSSTPGVGGQSSAPGVGGQSSAPGVGGLHGDNEGVSDSAKLAVLAAVVPQPGEAVSGGVVVQPQADREVKQEPPVEPAVTVGGTWDEVRKMGGGKG